MPRLTKTPWFGPRRFPNWGWTPITWQGWVVTVVLVGAMIAGARLIPVQSVKVAVVLVLIAVLLAVSVLTGTRPGWRRW